ncbi:DUF5313 domain-containing protein [Mycobacterium sp. NPDC003323]
MAATPTIMQRILYAYGKRLPASMREWVKEDLTGKGAIRRHMLRYAIPPAIILAPLWLLPASLYVHLEMTVPIYTWALIMAFVLNKVWRRHRLSQHGLDPALIDTLNREKNARLHEDYARRYGARPDEAKWQSNPSPF